jgi:hypothetical protein
MKNTYGNPEGRVDTWSPKMRKWWRTAHTYGHHIKLREGGGNANHFGTQGKPSLAFNLKYNSMYLPISP